MRTLLLGDINDISGCVRQKLSSNNQFKNSFTKDEHVLLAAGDHKKWDVSMLFKIIQKVCGLQPAGDIKWTGGEECLENLIYKLKELRNKLVHDFELVLSNEQLEERLNELTDLALRMILALEASAKSQGKKIPGNESAEIMEKVFKIVDDVKQKINEGAPGLVRPQHYEQQGY